MQRPCAANPAIASLLQSTPPAGGVAEIGPVRLSHINDQFTMKTKTTVVSIALSLAVMLAFTGSGQSQEKNALSREEVLKQMQGTWVCVAEGVGGKALTKAEVKLKNRRLTIFDAKFRMTRVMNEKRGTYEGLFDAKPAVPFGEFDFIGKGPAGNYIERIGIYQLDGDTFRLCYGDPNSKNPERPSTLETAPGGGRECFEFKRQKEQ
jgi:uncharacterized protein (TIGR03067 family)